MANGQWPWEEINGWKARFLNAVFLPGFNFLACFQRDRQKKLSDRWILLGKLWLKSLPNTVDSKPIVSVLKAFFSLKSITFEWRCGFKTTRKCSLIYTIVLPLMFLQHWSRNTIRLRWRNNFINCKNQFKYNILLLDLSGPLTEVWEWGCQIQILEL